MELSNNKRILLFLVGILFMALGSVLSLVSNLGVAPMVTLAYTTSIALNIDYAILNFVNNFVLLVLQILVQKELQRRQFTQLIVVIIFAFLIKVFKELFASVVIVGFSTKLIILVISCFITAIGAVFTIKGNIVLLPAEGFVNSVAKKRNIQFGTARISVEICVVLFSILVTLLAHVRSNAVGLGTVISVFLVGFFANCLARVFTNK